MLPLIMLLWCWTGYFIGFVTFIATHPSVASAEEALDDTTYLDPSLFEKALIHAKAMAVTDDPQYKQHRKVRRAEDFLSLPERSGLDELIINFTLALPTTHLSTPGASKATRSIAGWEHRRAVRSGRESQPTKLGGRQGHISAALARAGGRTVGAHTVSDGAGLLVRRGGQGIGRECHQ